LSRDTFHCRYIREGHALGCISIPALVRGRPSTALTPTQDPAQYLVPNVALRQLPSYHAPEKYGTITGDAFAPNVPVPATKPKEMKDGAMDFSGGKKAEKEKKEEGKVKEVAVKKETKSVEQPKKVSWSRSWSWGQTWTWSRCAEFCGWTSHGWHIQAEVKKVEPPKKEPAKATSKAKKRVIHSDDEDEDDGEGESQSKAGNLPAESSSSKKAAAIKEPTSSMVREADRAAMEAMMGMDMDMDADLDLAMVDEAEESADKSGTKGTKGSKETKSKDVENKVKKESQEGAGTSRKRRKVKKSKTEMDDKGYMSKSSQAHLRRIITDGM
jgi:DNA polymerase delta subunit 3